MEWYNSRGGVLLVTDFYFQGIVGFYASVSVECGTLAQNINGVIASTMWRIFDANSAK